LIPANAATISSFSPVSLSAEDFFPSSGNSQFGPQSIQINFVFLETDRTLDRIGIDLSVHGTSFGSALPNVSVVGAQASNCRLILPEMPLAT
jgi:hypothetical protein